MALAAEDITQITVLIQKELQKLPEQQQANVRYELDLRERMVRVEEALKHQGDELKAQREMMQLMMSQMEKRFEQVDKRFESMQQQIDKRFEQVDKRFESQHNEIMAIHQEIKQQMRWFFATTVGVGGLVVAVLRLWPPT